MVAIYKERLARLREDMERVGLDALLSMHPINQYYLTGTAQYQILVVTKVADPVILVKRNIERARAESWLPDIRPLGDVREDLVDLAREMDLRNRRIGIEFGLTTAAALKETETILPSCHFVDSDGVWLHCRKIKQPEEIAKLRRAQSIVDEVHADMPQILVEGAREVDVVAELDYRLKKLGSEAMPFFFGTGGRPMAWRATTRLISGADGATPTDYPVVGGAGLSPATPHGPSTKIIQPGEQFSIDIMAVVEGYHADSGRTYFVGEPSRRLRDMYMTALYAERVFIDGARPGVVVGDLVKKVVSYVEARGYGDYFMGPRPHNSSVIGHGVGLYINEYPFVSASVREVLRPGMVIAVEPKVVVPEVGCVEVEDTVVITESGCELLSNAPKELDEVILPAYGHDRSAFAEAAGFRTF
ncbi:MAG: aminopeptidase P family protein [Chloroflexi bacterium]|nr:aminopeptidase P family protein [Chloroflexota bacterium]